MDLLVFIEIEWYVKFQVLGLAIERFFVVDIGYS
jgi:hypothetical protein